MKKVVYLILCLIAPYLLPMHAHAEDNKKFSYCGGNIKFYIPDFFDKKYIEKQSEPYTCKNGFMLKSKIGNKKTYIDINQAGNQLPDEKDINAEYLGQFKDSLPRRLHLLLSNDNPNGGVRIITFYWLTDQSILKKIRQEFYFSKEDKLGMYASYTANVNDVNDILFMNALEQLFLSAEIDW